MRVHQSYVLCFKDIIVQYQQGTLPQLNAHLETADVDARFRWATFSLLQVEVPVRSSQHALWMSLLVSRVGESLSPSYLYGGLLAVHVDGRARRDPMNRVGIQSCASDRHSTSAKTHTGYGLHMADVSHLGRQPGVCHA